MIIILKAYKYRLYPTQEQQTQLSKTFGCVRYVYNYYLNKKIELYKNEGKSMSKIDCNNHLNRSLKDELTWLREVDKFSLTNAIYNLHDAYDHFFRDKKVGFPKFKSKRIHHYSYTTNYTNGNIEADFTSNTIKLPKLKWVNCKLHRNFYGQIKSATLSQVPSGKYFVSVLVETEQIPIAEAEANGAIGFDLGIKEYLIDSEGIHMENPKTLKKYEEKLGSLQRRLFKKEKGSRNWEKERIKVARLHEKISNIRNDYAHKLSSKIINENQVIISEDLQIKSMVKNHQVAKSISDAGWGNFLRQIEYKAKWSGRVYHKVSPWFASSQICSVCGHKNQKLKLLSIREWECDVCSATHQRDENAAHNILKQGLKELAILT